MRKSLNWFFVIAVCICLSACNFHVHEYICEITKEGNCTEEGVKTFTCECGDEYTEISPITHTYSEQVVVPTCTENGYTIFTCACGDTYNDNEVSATGHKYIDTVNKEPTCTEAGEMNRVCECGHQSTVSIEKIQHSYTSSITAPTCTENGYTTFTCICGDVYKGEEVAAVGHKYDEKVTKEPTCTEVGIKTMTCKCGETYTASVERIAHEYTSSVTAPTCTEKGYTTYTCICGDSYNSDEVTATGHLWEEWEIVQAPTVESTGVSRRDCSKCDAFENKDIPKLEDTATTTLVWIPTKGGTRYHSRATCSNMDDPIQVTLAEAITKGFTACKKCSPPTRTTNNAKGEVHFKIVQPVECIMDGELYTCVVKKEWLTIV